MFSTATLGKIKILDIILFEYRICRFKELKEYTYCGSCICRKEKDDSTPKVLTFRN